MADRFFPSGLRARLVIAIFLITLGVLMGTFFALHEGIGADIQSEIDRELRVQYAEFEQETQGVKTSAELLPAARRFINSQTYHPASLIFAIRVGRETQVTNAPEVIEREVKRESHEAQAGGGAGPSTDARGEHGAPIISTPSGFSTVSSGETGRLRVFARPVVRDGRTLGQFRAANPLTAVEEAQEGLRNTFLVVGLVALVVAIVLAAGIAGLLTRPLRRIAEFASAVDAGDLTQRVRRVGGSGEARILADSFNNMLDRVEQAFRRQRQFVADASHELRTPLTVLRGEIELLRRNHGASGEDRERAEKLLRELDHMERLVSDMLTLAAADSGGLAVTNVDLDDFFSDLERDLPLFGEREYRVTPAGGELDADPDRLTQVLRNLVRNAVAHTDRGDRITVAASAENGNIEFAVSDEGPGIPTQHLDRLFDRFYRVDGGRAATEGGSGLGLAIAKAIVEAHGGRIWAESAPGTGATIRFALPGYRAR